MHPYLHAYGLGRTLRAILDTACDGAAGPGVGGGEVQEQVGQVDVHVIVSLHHLIDAVWYSAVLYYLNFKLK